MPSQPFLGQIMQVGFNFAPTGWALCNGQILAIQQNTALFSLLGTTYGGDGIRTFALPNLQSRVPIGFGQGNGLSNYVLGEEDGVESVTLTIAQNPSHAHVAESFGRAAGDSGTAANNTWARTSSGDTLYQNPASGSANMAAVATTAAGSSQPHENRQPYLVINFVIALQGIFPQRQ